MDTAPLPIRRIPLKVAGVIGFFSAALYLAVLFNLDDTSFVAAGIGWLVVMTLAACLAWFADKASGKERLFAIVASVIFFVLAMFSATLIAIIYLVAAAMAFIGWFKVDREEAPIA